MSSLEQINIKKDDIVIDCGANVGDITNYFAEKGAIVYAFEPNPYAFRVLEYRFRGNERVICIKKAVSDASGTGKLFFHESASLDHVKYSTGSSMVGDKNNVNEETFEEVEIINLSEFISDLDKPVKVLKIDIEGEEHKILNQMIDNGTILSIPFVFVETHEKKVPSCRPGMAEVRRKIEALDITNINLDWI